MHGSFLSLHRRSIRLEGFDYSRSGWYFVTICCDRQVVRSGGFPFRGSSGPFGTIRRQTISLSGLGAMVRREWQRLGNRFVWAEMDDVVVMPDHLHGLIYIVDGDVSDGVGGRPPNVCGRSVPKLIQAFKSTTTWRAKREFGVAAAAGARLWQRNYYESIIRNQRHLAAVRRYIVDNPARMAVSAP
ncbi:MAG TPA: transposase [Gemmatimonadales bacterium]|nr:transposase [Gemmatimonadales bacterium]